MRSRRDVDTSIFMKMQGGKDEQILRLRKERETRDLRPRGRSLRRADAYTVGSRAKNLDLRGFESSRPGPLGVSPKSRVRDSLVYESVSQE